MSGAAPLDRVLRALNHPIRRRILRALVDGTGSATTISQKTGMDLSLVSYHLSQVLAKECDIVELVDTVPRRGAVEKFYRLKFHALSGADPGDAQGEQPSSRRMSFEECFIVAVSAMDADVFAALEGSGWDWSLAEVDAVAWRRDPRGERGVQRPDAAGGRGQPPPGRRGDPQRRRRHRGFPGRQQRALEAS